MNKSPKRLCLHSLRIDQGDSLIKRMQLGIELSGSIGNLKSLDHSNTKSLVESQKFEDFS